MTPNREPEHDLEREPNRARQLTMAITGESLFNDGSAVILFTLFFDLHLRGLGSVFSNSGIDEFEFDQVPTRNVDQLELRTDPKIVDRLEPVTDPNG